MHSVLALRPGQYRLVLLRLALLLVLVCATTGCAGLTAREKGALVGGAGGAAGGALLGSAAGSAAIGAAIGGPVGLVGGYLLGDHFFTNHPSRQRPPSPARGRSSSSRANGQSRNKARASETTGQPEAPPRGEAETGRIF